VIALLSVSRTNDITLTRMVETRFQCLRLSNIDNQSFLVGTWNKQIPLCTVDILGNEEYITNVSFPGTYYNDSEYIVSEKLLALTIRGINGVYLRILGNDRGKLVKDKRISRPMGVCAGPRGTLFVCCDHCIVQMTYQGDVVTTYDVNMKLTKRVRVSKDGSRMAVVNADPNNKQIKMFKTPT